MHERMDRTQQGDVAVNKPSDYLRRFYYDTILHDPMILKWLTGRVSAERVALGTDYSFPPADNDPLATARAAGLTDDQVKTICEDTPRALFPRLPAL
jgi:aminocarboxymuconate-semialdehyde decarboxylase